MGFRGFIEQLENDGQLTRIRKEVSTNLEMAGIIEALGEKPVFFEKVKESNISVVGGLVEQPIIAVPTSVGYGSSFEGLSALLTMMNSCAPGVAVVNIDNGFGAAVMAYSILRSVAK